MASSSTPSSEMIQIKTADFIKCCKFFMETHHNTCFYVPKDMTVEEFLAEMGTAASLWNFGLQIQKIGHKVDEVKGNGDECHEIAGKLFEEAMKFIEKIEKSPK